MSKFKRLKNWICGSKEQPKNPEISDEMSLEQAVQNLHWYAKRAEDMRVSGEEYVIPYDRAIRVDVIPRTKEWSLTNIDPSFIFRVFPWDEGSLNDENNEVFKISPKDFAVKWVLVKKDI